MHIKTEVVYQDISNDIEKDLMHQIINSADYRKE